MTKPDCKKLNCQNAGFGFSISSVKDLDLDGYNGEFICKCDVFLVIVNFDGK